MTRPRPPPRGKPVCPPGNPALKPNVVMETASLPPILILVSYVVAKETFAISTMTVVQETASIHYVPEPLAKCS